MKTRYFRILSRKLVSLALLGLLLNTQISYAQDEENEEDCPGPGCPAIRTTGQGSGSDIFGGIVGGIIGGAIIQEALKQKQIKVKPSSLSDNTGLPQVRVIQIMLNAVGFNPGPIDGFSGPRTTDAIKRFQNLIGDETSGVLNGEQTGRLLGTFFEQSQDTDILQLTDTRTSNETGEIEEGTAINLACIPDGIEFRCSVSSTVPATQRSVSP